MRYVFVSWVLPDGNLTRANTVAIVVDRDVVLKALSVEHISRNAERLRRGSTRCRNR